MFDELPPKVGGWFRVFGWLFVVFVVLAILGGLLFPAVSGPHTNHRSSWAKSDAANLCSAIKSYRIEYGKWPDFTGDGLFLNGTRNAQLLRTLCAKDEASNPRKVVFIEGRTAEKNSDGYGGGFHPETGAYLDPWGSPYLIAIDADYDDQIANPYSDDPPLKVGKVIVWSLGKDGQQGAPANSRTLKGSDDVVSWQ